MSFGPRNGRESVLNTDHTPRLVEREPEVLVDRYAFVDPLSWRHAEYLATDDTFDYVRLVFLGALTPGYTCSPFRVDGERRDRCHPVELARRVHSTGQVVAEFPRRGLDDRR